MSIKYVQINFLQLFKFDLRGLGRFYELPMAAYGVERVERVELRQLCTFVKLIRAIGARTVVLTDPVS